MTDKNIGPALVWPKNRQYFRLDFFWSLFHSTYLPQNQVDGQSSRRQSFWDHGIEGFGFTDLAVFVITERVFKLIRARPTLGGMVVDISV